MLQFVYTVTKSVMYEGDTVVGIFSTLDSAVKFMAKCQEKSDDYRIANGLDLDVVQYSLARVPVQD